jgi:hypothetical protein
MRFAEAHSGSSMRPSIFSAAWAVVADTSASKAAPNGLIDFILISVPGRCS